MSKPSLTPYIGQIVDKIIHMKKLPSGKYPKDHFVEMVKGIYKTNTLPGNDMLTAAGYIYASTVILRIPATPADAWDIVPQVTTEIGKILVSPEDFAEMEQGQ